MMNIVQMNNPVEQYLKLYEDLSSVARSKEANRKLLEFQNSNDSWSVAQQLLKSTNPQQHLHGCQLLSKKLNKPLPPNIEPGSVFQFLITLPQLSSTLWLCVAKIIVHIGDPSYQIPKLEIKSQLSLLSQIPAALSQVHTTRIIDIPQSKRLYFAANKQLLIVHFNTHQNLVLKCLDSFVSYSTRIDCPEIVQLLLTISLDLSGFALEQILSHETYPSLETNILTYLHSNLKHPSIFPIYLAFYRTVDLNKLSYQHLQSMLATILREMERQEDQDSKNTALTDSYQLWLRLGKEAEKQDMPNDKLELLQQALIAMWGLACRKSTLLSLPASASVRQSCLSIDVDEQQQVEEDAGNHDNVNSAQLYIRTYSLDFLTLTINSLRHKPARIKAIFQQLIVWSSQPQILHLQLVLFILDSISDFLQGEQVSYCSQVMAAIISRQAEFNEYLCQRVVMLIGKLHTVLANHPQLLPNILNFVSHALSFPRLAPLASQSFSQLMEECTNMNSEVGFNFQVTIQQFLNYLYQNVFTQQAHAKVLQNLTRALIIFIYKFKGTPEYYQQFLQTFHQKISSINSLKQRARLLQASMLSQLWLNSKQKNRYLLVYSQFLAQQAPLIAQLAQNAQKKQQLTQAVNLLNFAIKTQAILNIQVWIQSIEWLLNHYLQIEQPLPILVTPLINLAKTVEKLQQPHIIEPVLKTLAKWEKNFTNTLQINNKQIKQSNLAGNIIQLHLAIARLFIKNLTYSTIYPYSPAQILIYLDSLLDSSIWEYQSFKYSLHLLLVLMQLGHSPVPLLGLIIRNYGKLSDTLWTSIEPILSLSYQRYGIEPFRECIQKYHSALLPPNPLWKLVVDAFEHSETKNLKNLLLCIP